VDPAGVVEIPVKKQQQFALNQLQN